MSQENALLHALWRKALERPEGLRVPCKTKANAQRLRYSLYNSVKKYREGLGRREADEKLLEAIDNCSLGVIPDPGEPGAWQLAIRRKIDTELMATVLEVLGGPEALETAVPAETAAARESQLRVLRMLELEAQEERDAGSDAAPNSYYSR